MNRFFGTSKPKVPLPTLGDAIKSTEARAEHFDVKIKQMDAELLRYKEQMSKMRDGPAKNAIKQKAMAVLKRKKAVEAQRDQQMNVAWNMEQTNMAIDNVKGAIVQVDTMKQANVALKSQVKKINLDQIDKMQDDMEDMLDDVNEIQESLGRQYGVPDNIDEADLEAELEGLGDEMLFEEEAEPSYLADPVLDMPTAGSSEPSQAAAATGQMEAPLKI